MCELLTGVDFLLRTCVRVLLSFIKSVDCTVLFCQEILKPINIQF